MLRWSLLAPTFAVGVVAACGLDTVGEAPDATVPAPDGQAVLPDRNDGGDERQEASVDDAKAPETCPWPALERDAPWPMIGGCVGHPGRTVHHGPKQQPKIVWKVTVTTRESQPVIGADGTIYLPADVSGVVAFDPDGGRRPFPDAGTGVANNVTNAPSIGADGTLYFGSERSIVAHGKDGTHWRARTNDEIDTSTLVGEDGTVYSGSFDDMLYAVAPDGGIRWKVDLGGDVWAAAAMGPSGHVYVGSDDRLFALEQDGGQSWVFRTTGNVQSSPVVADDGTIYVGTLGKSLHAVSSDGGAKWTFATRGNFGWQQLPALDEKGTIYAPTDRYLAAIDTADGGLRWERNVGVMLRTSVVVDADGVVYVGGDGRMFAYAPDGDQLWAIDVGANPSGFAIARDGTIFVACNGNTLLAIHE